MSQPPQISSPHDIIRAEDTPNFSIIEGRVDSSILLTCEHASNALPAGETWANDRSSLRASHWAWDPGAADLTRQLAKCLQSPALLATWSRLWVDLNRPIGSDTMFRPIADDRPIMLNTTITARAEQSRIDSAYRPYHAKLHQLMAAMNPALGFSIHTFTPVYQGTPRAVEIGVLFDDADAQGHALVDAFSLAGFRAQANAPWSGKKGMMFAIEDATTGTDCIALEIEVRQDIATTIRGRNSVVDVLAAMLPNLFNPRDYSSFEISVADPARFGPGKRG